MAFTPRLTSDGIQGNPWWYSNGNPFYASGYGMPNCTCYAYGRYAEIRDGFANLPTGNGGDWFDNVDTSTFNVGDTPFLGAVMCWKSKSGAYAGHVAIVEEISETGVITTSNSGWQSTYFWLDHLTADNGYIPSWASDRDYVMQGFIYNDTPETDPSGKPSKHKMPLWMMLRPY